MNCSDNEELDLKLKALIKLSKENNDSRRAAIVFYLLIRRILNEKGIYLGFAPLISKKERRAFEYMNAINSVMESSFNFHLFDKEMVNKVQKYELLYLKGPSLFSFDSLKELINIYYDLRKLEVPNMYNINNDICMSESSLIPAAHQFLLIKNNSRTGLLFKKGKEDHLRQYLTLDLTQKEQNIQNTLKKAYNKTSFEQLLHFRKLKQDLKNGISSKFMIKGKIKENSLYRQSLNEIPGFFLLGFAFVFLMLSIVFFIQDFIRPEIAGSFTIISFMLFGSAILIILIYWKLFYQERRIK